MAQNSRLSWQDVALHSVAGIALALLLWTSGALDKIELRTFDLRVELNAAPVETTGSIVIISLDQVSLDWVGENMGLTWPWPRQLYGAIINNCARRGAKVIGFDVLFTEYTSKEYGYDLYLRDSITTAGNVVLGSVFAANDSGSGQSRWPQDIPRPAIQVKNGAGLPSYSRAIFPIPELGGAAKILSNVQHQPDKDATYRRMHPLALFDGEALPSLALGMYLAAKPDLAIHVQNGNIVLGDREAPVDAKGMAILNYRGPARTFAGFSASRFIRSEFMLENDEIKPEDIPRDLEGRYVLFGFTAPGLFDSKTTPLGVMPGTEVNATLLDNLLAGDCIRPFPTGWAVASVVILTLLAVLVVSRFNAIGGQIGASCAFLFLPGLTSMALYRLGSDFTLVPVQIGVMTGLAATLARAYFIIKGRERFIRRSFRHYLSPQVIDRLLEDPDRLRLGGERKELSLFFSDLEGFTTISEGLDPEDLTQLLNEYLTDMTDIILEEGGTVDKFEGDAIIAFWNAPMDVDNHAERAVRAALRCQKKLDERRPYFLEQYGKVLRMRIGINTGFAIVGNMGSSTRFDYSVLGDSVNLAARLEGANKYFHTYTMISGATRKQLGESFYCRELARLRVVGKNEPVTVFEPLSFDGPVDDCQDFNQGRDLFYRGDFASALEAFSRSADDDPAARAYCKKCEAMQTKTIAGWCGVWELESK